MLTPSSATTPSLKSRSTSPSLLTCSAPSEVRDTSPVLESITKKPSSLPLVIKKVTSSPSMSLAENLATTKPSLPKFSAIESSSITSIVGVSFIP